MWIKKQSKKRGAVFNARIKKQGRKEAVLSVWIKKQRKKRGLYLTRGLRSRGRKEAVLSVWIKNMRKKIVAAFIAKVEKKRKVC